MAAKNLGRVRQRLIDMVRQQGYRTLFRDALWHVMDGLYKNGLRKQLQFILQVIGTDAATRLIKDLINEDRAIKQAANVVEASGLNKELVCSIYDEHIKEAHNVVRSGTREQLRYLARQRGISRTVDLVRFLQKQKIEERQENTETDVDNEES